MADFGLHAIVQATDADDTVKKLCDSGTSRLRHVDDQLTRPIQNSHLLHGLLSSLRAEREERIGRFLSVPLARRTNGLPALHKASPGDVMQQAS